MTVVSAVAPIGSTTIDAEHHAPRPLYAPPAHEMTWQRW
jgi:hypothetical protein